MTPAAPPRSFSVLITRPVEDAAPLAAELRDHGIRPLIEPLLRVELLDGPPVPTDGVQAVLATSANGVRALAARLARRDLPLFAVGDATAAAARDAGFIRVESAGGDVESLAALVVRRLDPADGAVLHAAGTDVAGDLAGRLAERRFVCRRVVLYRAVAAERLTEAAARALAEGALDAVLLFSPRTAAAFARLLGEADLVPACRRLTACCLSAAVARAVVGLPWRRTIVADRPDRPALIRATLATAEEEKAGRGGDFVSHGDRSCL